MMDWECDDFGDDGSGDDSGKVDDFANAWAVDDLVRDCGCDYDRTDAHVLQIPID